MKWVQESKMIRLILVSTNIDIYSINVTEASG